MGVLERGGGGGGLGCFIPLPGSPPLSNHRYGVTQPGWCRRDTALGTECPGHPGRVSTAWLRSRVFAAQGRLVAVPTGLGTAGTATSRTPQGFKAVASWFWQYGGMQTPERSLLALTSATSND